jgi:hypothetical protein
VDRNDSANAAKKLAQQILDEPGVYESGGKVARIVERFGLYW